VTLETGNASEAGAASRGWFVGDLAAWATSRGEMPEANTPRQSTALEVKWLVHPPGDRRAAWADRDRSFALSVLVAGEMQLEFRSVAGIQSSVRLARPADYVLWHGPTYSHVWSTDSGCTILTIRWPVTPERR
jgi:hypothetical protein